MMKRQLIPLLAAGWMLACGEGRAQLFFTTPTPRFLTPSWRGTAGTEFSHWDVFYSPYADPLVAGSGVNFPDIAAPNGTGDFASALGWTPPANANPSDPFAYWHAANPTLRQVGTESAFIIGAGASGNIYSFAAATAYELADTTPFTAGTVMLQWQTDGQLFDFSTLKLVAGGVEYTPTNFVTEYRSSSSSFGGITNRAAAQWNLTGLGITSYTIEITAAGSSHSLQELRLDTAPTYLEAVPSPRTRLAATGLWSDAASWSPAVMPSTGGNVSITGGSSLTVDGGVREIGELKLSAPGTFTLGGSGGGVLKLNTGITATPATDTTYVFDTPVTFGAYNLHDLNEHTTVVFNQPISGSVGVLLTGAGTTVLNGAHSPASAIGVDPDATLLVHGSLSGSGALNLFSGTLGGSGTISRPFTLDGGDTLSPGASVGTLTTAAQTWAGGGELRLELRDASGTPGVGWDLVNIGGSLSITADSAARFTLRLQTLSAGAPGLLAGFDAASPYAWKFLGVTGGSITSFASTDFAIDTTGFLNPLAGDFSVARTGNDLFLNYTPVPEPQAAVLAILGLAGFAVWRNRSVIAGRDHRD
jgi:hypothetical protein